MAFGLSAAVRIPASILQAAHLEINDAVDVRDEGGRIVIEPIRRKSYDLDELVGRITRVNLHSEIDFKGPEGKEVW